MTFQDTEIPTNAAANSLFDKEKRINSFYDLTVSAGTDSAATVLATLTPMGFNNSTSKWGKWLAPDPTVSTLTLTGATGGTFLLGVNGVNTSPLAWNASAAVVAAAIKGLGYTATVSLATLVYTITWTDQALYDTLPTVTADFADLTGDAAASATATPGTAAPAPLTPTSLTFDTGTRTGGTWTITHGAQTTGNVTFGDSPAVVEAALAALTTPSVVANCTKTSPTTYHIDFDSYTDLVTLPTVSVTDSLTGGADDAVSEAEAGTALVPDPTILTVDVGTATGGTFTITVDGEATAAIAFDAADAAFDAAILAATGIVSTTSSGVVTFGSLPELIVLPIVSGDITDLTGAVIALANVAGTAINGLNKVKGFVYPEAVTLSATEDTMVVVSIKGEYFYDDIEDNVAAGDQTALKTALRDYMLEHGVVIQGLTGIV